MLQKLSSEICVLAGTKRPGERHGQTSPVVALWLRAKIQLRFPFGKKILPELFHINELRNEGPTDQVNLELEQQVYKSHFI